LPTVQILLYARNIGIHDQLLVAQVVGYCGQLTKKIFARESPPGQPSLPCGVNRFYTCTDS